MSDGDRCERLVRIEEMAFDIPFRQCTLITLLGTVLWSPHGYPSLSLLMTSSENTALSYIPTVLRFLGATDESREYKLPYDAAASYIAPHASLTCK